MKRRSHSNLTWEEGGVVHLARGKCHLRHQTRGEGGQGYHEHPPEPDIHGCGLCLSGENKMTHDMTWLARLSN